MRRRQGAAGFQDPISDAQCLITDFQHADELSGRHQATVGTPPAQQSFGTHHFSGFQVVLGLEVQLEIALLKGLAKILAMGNTPDHETSLILIVLDPGRGGDLHG